jgi:hypothetical protein
MFASATTFRECFNFPAFHLDSQISTLKPQTSNCNPQTSNLKPQTSNLKPQTSILKPQSTIDNSQSSILNPQSLKVNLKISILTSANLNRAWGGRACNAMPGLDW